MIVNEKYIDPFTDFGFKKLFGNESNKDLLIDFLNQVLADREQVRDLTYLNAENLGETEWDRRAVFDLYCENERGEKFIIEMQNVSQRFFRERSIFYASCSLREQAPKGKGWDFNLSAVYTIGVLNFSLPGGDPGRYVREVQLMDIRTFEVLYEKLTFIYLELPKFRKTEEQLVTHFDKWLYVLNNLPALQEIPATLREGIFVKLFNQAEIAKLSPEDMRTYEQSLKVYRDNQNTMDYAIETAEEKGMQKGLQKGLQMAMVKVAREMKSDGFSFEKIARFTGLTREEIESL